MTKEFALSWVSVVLGFSIGMADVVGWIILCEEGSTVHCKM